MSRAKNTSLNKGFAMEEALRNYFIKTGYYVIRGVPFTFGGFDITDIDLWLYSRTSSVSREITIVDAKNKKTPQAIERIFWIQGLKKSVNATNAIIATTDKRPEVKDFGAKNGILVLDGNFISKLNSFKGASSERLSDEEFFSKISEYPLNKLDGNWKKRVIFSKNLLSKSLSFDSCNEWLNHASFFANQSIINKEYRQISLRCLYLICSFIAITIDFLMKEFSFLDQIERKELLNNGFAYGSRGNEGLRKILDLTMGLVEQYSDNGQAISAQVRQGIERRLSELKSSILSEYFSKKEVSMGLFSVAREFEELAMKRDFISHSMASLELQSMLFCFLDFWGLDRPRFSF